MDLTEYGKVIIICLCAIGAGTILGNGAVWFFNKMPGKWLCDYGETPSEELLHPTVQRVRSTPWKYLFSGFYIAVGIRLGMYDPLYAVAALAAMWLLLEMSIADKKYMIVPDQLIMLLVVTGFGFIPFHKGGPMDCLWGALAGFGIMLIIAIIGKIIYKKDTLGGGDIKVFAALGLAAGLDGVLIIFVLTTLLSSGHFALLLMRKRVKMGEQRPMVPYIAAAATIYLVILRQISYNILIAL